MMTSLAGNHFDATDLLAVARLQDDGGPGLAGPADRARRPPAPGRTQITAAAPSHPGQQLTPALMGTR